MVIGTDGNLYGTTYFGGASNAGTVFELPSGSSSVTVLASFNGTNGSHPVGGLMQGSDGNFYGTTTYGGVGGRGTVFQVPPAGVLSTLVAF